MLDTNVLVSALLWSGLPNRLLQYAENHKLTVCLTPILFTELLGVLSRPKFAARIVAQQASVETIAEGMLRLAEMYPDLPIPPVIREDPEDDAVLACAHVSTAQAIVTGDPHLLRIKRYRNIPIFTPRQFLQNFKL